MLRFLPRLNPRRRSGLSGHALTRLSGESHRFRASIPHARHSYVLLHLHKIKTARLGSFNFVERGSTRPLHGQYPGWIFSTLAS